MKASIDQSAPKLTITRWIILAMLLGAVVGSLYGAEVAALGAVGKLLIQLIKSAAAPLIFVAILEALLTTHIPRRLIARYFLIIIINSTVAITIALLIANLTSPGKYLHNLNLIQDIDASSLAAFKGKKIDLISVISGYIPQNIVEPFLQNNIIAIVLLALLFGIALRQIQIESALDLSAPLKIALRTLEKVIFWLVHLVPLAVFAVTAQTVGQYGFAPFKGLTAYILACLGGLTLQCLIVYQIWIAIVGRIKLREFWKAAYSCVTYAFATNSSLATLPLTLQTLDKLKISKAASRLGACVGTNLNNDGILLYEGIAVLFIAQAVGLELTIVEQIGVALLSLVAAIGVAGVPEAGIVSLSLVLTSVGLPIEILPLLLTVDWIVARARSVTNVLSDMTVAIALNQQEAVHPGTAGILPANGFNSTT